MTSINNLKQIREIYGATQEQIARALSVNRVTVANWENGSTMASSANREKMSIYYGIGPEFFYEQELTDQVKQMIRQTAEKEQTVVSESDGKKNKQEDFHKMFEAVSFDRVMRDYMMFTKILLAKADDIHKKNRAQVIDNLVKGSSTCYNIICIKHHITLFKK